MGENYNRIKKENETLKKQIKIIDAMYRDTIKKIKPLRNTSVNKKIYTVANIAGISNYVKEISEPLKKIGVYIYDTSDFVDVTSPKHLYILSTGQMSKELVISIIKDNY